MRKAFARLLEERGRRREWPITGVATPDPDLHDVRRMNVKRIVVGTDFSAPANHALDVAVSLATSVGAKVTLVHAYEIPTIGFPGTTFLSTADVEQAFRSAAKSALDACTANYVRRGSPYIPCFAWGRRGPR